MLFKGSCPVEERIALFRDFDTGVFTVAELCARYGVSRQTFYEWKDRRESGDLKWYEERSHATRSCPHATPEAIACEIVATRERFLHFGPKKIKARLELERKRCSRPTSTAAHAGFFE